MQCGQCRGLKSLPTYLEQPGHRQLRSENAPAPTTIATKTAAPTVGDSPKNVFVNPRWYEIAAAITGVQAAAITHCLRRRTAHACLISDFWTSVKCMSLSSGLACARAVTTVMQPREGATPGSRATRCQPQPY